MNSAWILQERPFLLTNIFENEKILILLLGTYMEWIYLQTLKKKTHKLWVKSPKTQGKNVTQGRNSSFRSFDPPPPRSKLVLNEKKFLM